MPNVVTGSERLFEEGPACAGLADGARVAVLAHPAAVDRTARYTVDRCIEDPRLEVARLFAPEHGLRGEAQDMEAVEDTRDATYDLPVRSLYGTAPVSLTPRAEDLADVDAVLCDLQDVGTRFYTFVYTIGHVMEAAGRANVPVVVLDRPNPIGGDAVEGPVLDPSMASFVGRYPIPVRHGMTAGELARMFSGAFGVRCDLRVVAMSGWRREAWFDETGLPWVAPSPNMPTLDTAAVYPGACLIEGTDLSEGRGTTRPFEHVGAPAIDARTWRREVEAADLPGVAFREVAFRPKFQKHADRDCAGLFVHVLDRGRFRPFRTYLTLLATALRRFPDAFDWRREPYEFESDRLAIDLLLGDPRLRPALESGTSPVDLEASWTADLARFLEARSAFLLYD